MPKTKKPGSPAKKAAKTRKSPTAKVPGKNSKAKLVKPVKLPKKKHLQPGTGELTEHAQVLSSEVVYQGSLFRVTQDKIIEPSGKESVRDIVRHNGSAVILAVDSSKSKKDPWIVIERQFR